MRAIHVDGATVVGLILCHVIPLDMVITEIIQCIINDNMNVGAANSERVHRGSS